jgi:hypothetical protein
MASSGLCSLNRTSRILNSSVHPTHYTMDAISGAASLVALIEAVAVVGVAAVELCRNVHGAPKEIGRVTSYLLTVKVELECLQLLQTDQDIARCFTSPETQELFKNALQSSELTIQAIHDACQRRCDNARKGSIARFQWAILDRKTVNVHPCVPKKMIGTLT